MKFRFHLYAVLFALTLCLSAWTISEPAHAASYQATKTSHQLTARSHSSSAATLSVQKIAVVNDAGFVLNFSVAYKNANGSTSYSAPSDNYPIDQSRTIDVSTLGLATGTSIWPHVNAIAGNTEDGIPVQYAANGQVATYEVQGTTLNYTVTLLS
jgi:hypothetical protein